MSDITPTFHGEMQLAGWSESHNSGCKVTFWLQSSEDLEAFRALTVRKGNTAGQRFMAALVEVGDDELPVQREPEPEKPKGGALAKLAGMWSNEQEFWNFSDSGNAEEAAEWIREICLIDSRAELDNSLVAKQNFEKFVRGPYMKYRASRGLK
jgi:hypothetical protein